MTKKQFLHDFAQQNFNDAADVFVKLDPAEQQNLLKELYYQAREAKTPVAVSVLYRKLHDGKTFDDFYNTWLPPKQYMKPFKIGDKTYYNFFDGPTRVLNAINFEDPKEVISVGLVWAEEKQFLEEVEKVKKANSNRMRGDAISLVADKISAKIYKVRTDTNLGN